MTNFEYWKERILEISSQGRDFGLSYKEEMMPCNSKHLICGDCVFCDFINSCYEKKYNWLYAEHVEKPKLTKKERMFCELVEDGWIVRHPSGSLWCSKNEPTKLIDDEGSFGWMPSAGILIDCRIPGCEFNFVKIDDEKPWSIEDLLRLEDER